MTQRLLLLALAALGPAPVAAVPPAPACLSGRVLDVAGRPVERASVALVAREEATAPSRRVALTTADGLFAATAVPPGSYWLVVERFGFEPEILPFDLAPGQEARSEVRLSPLDLLLTRIEGARELPWLLRGMMDDPLRLAEGSEAGPPPGRSVQGRVAWNALAGDGEGPGSGLVGKRATVDIGGQVLSEFDWYVDGRLDRFGAGEEGGAGEAVESGALRYGLGYGEADNGIRFQGEIKRASRRPEDGASSLLERRASYVVDYSSGGAEGLGVSFAYRASLAEEGIDPETDPVGEHHSIWEGRGHYARRIADRHLLRTAFQVRAQQWSEPNANLLADALPRVGSLADAREFEPRSWQVFISESHEWSLLGRLSLVSGVDLSRSAGERGVPFLRPRVGGIVRLAPGTRLSGDWSWLVEDGEHATRRSLDESVQSNRFMATRVSFERDLASSGLLRVALVGNGYHELLEEPAEGALLRGDYLILASGPVESKEINVYLRTPARAGVAAYVAAAAGSAAGALSVLPVSYVEPGGSLRPAEGRLDYASAAVGCAVPRFGTDFVMRYHWLTGLADEGGDYARLDIEINQGLPWWEIGGSRIDVLVAIRRYLNRDPEPTVAERQLAFDPSPRFAAGVGVRF